ncbi:hypothetical protein GCM10010971_20270 [Silvimonas amylolytica]|uniref:Uncharacterized protein n=1 Tax=Silvimonas amylolytica TaxID=449663 RepID=A0ABQ2PLP8_9NEIS|nr:hypothetical protein GCM10010971_20270 [Silvimonas amylolytica]
MAVLTWSLTRRRSTICWKAWAFKHVQDPLAHFGAGGRKIAGNTGNTRLTHGQLQAKVTMEYP